MSRRKDWDRCQECGVSEREYKRIIAARDQTIADLREAGLAAAELLTSAIDQRMRMPVSYKTLDALIARLRGAAPAKEAGH